MSERRKLLVVDCAALGWSLAARAGSPPVTFRRAESVFPAVTCVAQASFRTASPPSAHGLVANGSFFRDLAKVLFWEQSARLVAGPRIWSALRARGKKVGMLFWQQSLGEDVDLVLSPRPIHKHEGGMIQDCYSQPDPLYAQLTARLGRPFNLMHYWGPLASLKSSAWIADATAAVMADASSAPDLLFSYLPHLDYDLQRRGPAAPAADLRLAELMKLVGQLREAAERSGYDWLFFGDYAMGEVTRPAVFPNRSLREAGLLRTRAIRGMAYPDFFSSPAFAMVDHEVAHVYCREPDAAQRAIEVLSRLRGVAQILDRSEQRDLGLNHPNSGDLVLVAEPGAWMAYPWWTDKREAPDFASHVDIHNKPGYDPCELFFGWPPLSVSQNTGRVKGTHGRVGEGAEIAWASSLDLAAEPRSLLDLADAVRRWCEQT